MESYLTMIYVTLEQESALKNFFVDQGWTYCKPDLSVITDKIGPVTARLSIASEEIDVTDACLQKEQPAPEIDLPESETVATNDNTKHSRKRRKQSHKQPTKDPKQAKTVRSTPVSEPGEMLETEERQNVSNINKVLSEVENTSATKKQVTVEIDGLQIPIKVERENQYPGEMNKVGDLVNNPGNDPGDDDDVSDVATDVEYEGINTGQTTVEAGNISIGKSSPSLAEMPKDGAAPKGHRGWPVYVGSDVVDIEIVTDALRKGPYGKCVYDNDNDVMSHQIQWLVDNYEAADGVSLPRSTVYDYFLRHCQEQNLEPMNSASFGKLIRSVFPRLLTRRLGTRGNSKYHYYGIRMKANSALSHFMDDQNQFADDLNHITDFENQFTDAQNQFIDDKTMVMRQQPPYQGKQMDQGHNSPVKLERWKAEHEARCTGQIVLDCKVCNREFADKTGLKRHVDAKHNNVIIPCFDCGRQYSSNSSLLKHRRNKHTVATVSSVGENTGPLANPTFM